MRRARARAAGDKAFTSIIQTRLLHVNNLEKSRLIDLVPAGYDSFLYLDSDTRIVGDVTLGFEMAERHGIAAVPAPNYNLGEYFGFGELMGRAGVKLADHMQYNAGVIFSHSLT
jgi:lipopolysaccharide biosynthesis glycosyltransferase